MKTNKPGLLSGKGGSPSKAKTASIGLTESGGNAMSKKGLKSKTAKSVTQPGGKRTSGFVR